jgi:hypothetical protein
VPEAIRPETRAAWCWPGLSQATNQAGPPGWLNGTAEAISPCAEYAIRAERSSYSRVASGHATSTTESVSRSVTRRLRNRFRFSLTTICRTYASGSPLRLTLGQDA